MSLNTAGNSRLNIPALGVCHIQSKASATCRAHLPGKSLATMKPVAGNMAVRRTRLSPALFVAHGHREVVPPDGRDAPVDIVVGGALAYPERRGRGFQREAQVVR